MDANQLVTKRPAPTDNHLDVPDGKHGEFWAMAQGRADYVVPAFPIVSSEHGTMMTIAATEEAIYVTKAQAMVFFDLQEKP